MGCLRWHKSQGNCRRNPAARRRSAFLPCGGCQEWHTTKYIKENISNDVDVIMTDEFAAYPFALDQAGMPKRKHRKILHRDRVYVDGDIYTNSVESAFSLLKRGIMGTWHRISAKHLQAYLDEMTWRFDNRKNPFLFRDTMLKLIASDNLEYKELTAA